MIKAAGRTADGRPLLIIGLSAANMDRLQAREPIVFDTAELSTEQVPSGLPPLVVAVVGGATEQDIADDLRETFLHVAYGDAAPAREDKP